MRSGKVSAAWASKNSGSYFFNLKENKKMDANKYLGLFIGIVILVAVVSATAGTMLNSIAGTYNGTHYVGGLGDGVGGTFSATGLGSLFSVTIFGIILVAAIFYALWKGIGGMK